MLHLMIPKLLFTTLTIKTELYCIRVILYKRYSIKQKEAVIEKTNKQKTAATTSTSEEMLCEVRGL